MFENVHVFADILLTSLGRTYVNVKILLNESYKNFYNH